MSVDERKFRSLNASITTMSTFDFIIATIKVILCRVIIGYSVYLLLSILLGIPVALPCRGGLSRAIDFM